MTVKRKLWLLKIIQKIKTDNAGTKKNWKKRNKVQIKVIKFEVAVDILLGIMLCHPRIRSTVMTTHEIRSNVHAFF